MREKFKNNMFYLGILLMSLTLFCEHLFFGETNFTCFLKGLSCGLEFVGIVIIFMKKQNRENIK